MWTSWGCMWEIRELRTNRHHNHSNMRSWTNHFKLIWQHHKRDYNQGIYRRDGRSGQTTTSTNATWGHEPTLSKGSMQLYRASHPCHRLPFRQLARHRRCLHNKKIVKEYMSLNPNKISCFAVSIGPIIRNASVEIKTIRNHLVA